MYLSKSDFQLASGCAKKLVYKKKRYATSNDTNEYMEMLAQGGYVVGKMATLLYPEGIEVTGTTQEALETTKRLLEANDSIVLFEPAIENNNRLARIDILVKNGNLLDLIEVKSASFDSAEKNNNLKKYIQDVAYQYTILKDCYPEYSITCKLLLPDKSMRTAIDGYAGWFKVIESEPSELAIHDAPEEIITQERSRFKKPEVEFIHAHSEQVQDYLDQIKQHGILNYKDVTAVVLKLEEAIREKSTQFLRILSNQLETEQEDYQISKACKACEYHIAGDLKCGFFECWNDATEFPSIFDLYYGGEVRGAVETSHWNELIQQKKYAFEDLDPTLFKTVKGEVGARAMRWITQYENTLANKEWFSSQLAGALQDLVYPLHFIDFETFTGAIPFHKGMRPYELIAFQWSCHTVRYPGAEPEHSEYIDTEADFPNFRFAESLMHQIGSTGTPLMWATHENSVLRTIRNQQEIFDHDNLQLTQWLNEIVREKDAKTGGRFVNMNKLTLDYYFHPDMKGKTSIKKVLPAIWNNFRTLHEIPWFAKYSSTDLNNLVIDPYDKLSELVAEDDQEEVITYGVDPVKGGTAAMRAYQRIRFDSSLSTAQKEELKKRLLEYCKLDTMAMVIIWEHWKNLTKTK